MIIGLGYKAKSGKDTAAQFLVEEYGFQTMAFADTLKAAAREVFGFSGAQLHGNLKEIEDDFWGLTPRFALQKMGTEAMRGVFGQDVWVRALQRRLPQSMDVVITDVRFPNEADAIKSWGGLLVRVDRPGSGASAGATQRSWRTLWRRKLHASEVAMDRYTGWDYVLRNHGSLEDLRHESVSLVKRALARVA